MAPHPDAALYLFRGLNESTHVKKPLFFGDFGPFENDPDGGDPGAGMYFGDVRDNAP